MAAVPGHGIQLVPSRGTIPLTVTSQGQENALQKSIPVNIGQYIEALCMDEIELCTVEGFSQIQLHNFYTDCTAWLGSYQVSKGLPNNRIRRRSKQTLATTFKVCFLLHFQSFNCMWRINMMLVYCVVSFMGLFWSLSTRVGQYYYYHEQMISYIIDVKEVFGTEILIYDDITKIVMFVI